MNILLSWIALLYFLQKKSVNKPMTKAMEADYDNEVDPEDIDEIEDVLALLDEEEEDSREI